MSKRHRSQSEGDLTDHICDNLTNKIMIVKDYELLNKVRIHKSILIYELKGEKGKPFLTGKYQLINT